MSSSSRFVERVRRDGFEPDVREFPQGTRTARDAAAAIGCTIDQIVKSLVFVADGRPTLVLTSGANRVDEIRLASTLDASEVRKADAEEVRSATGYAIGGTPPFGLDTDVAVVCDRHLLAFDQLWAAAGSPTAVFPITPGELVARTGARVVEV